MLNTVLIVLAMSGPGEVPVAPGAPLAVEPEDHHQIPPEYNDPWLRPPIWEPEIPIEPSYPRAAAFIPADPSNYTANGIKSFEYVVVHTVQGGYKGAISWFQNPSANVSAHYVMQSSDGEVTQMLDDHDRGWHVGGSNSYAIGIEHEGWVDDASWYTWPLYVESARLARYLCDTHDIPVDSDHVLGHVDLPNQTHTDPGPNWRWDLYIPLIEDVVPQGQVEGFVVDRTRQCTVTAVNDTWITTTMMPTDDHPDSDKCLLSAGDELTYLHASPDMGGQHRLVMEGGGPCAGVGDVEFEAFIWGPDFTEPCAPETAGAAGVTVEVAGQAVQTDADGRFVVDGVEPGDHVLDVLESGGYLGSTLPFDLEVYPGARVIIGVDPAEGGGTGGGDDPGGDDPDGDDPGGDDPGSSGGTTGDDPDPDDGGTDGDDSDGGPALPPGLGEGDLAEEGCACRATEPTTPAMLGWMVLLWVSRRTRRDAV